MSSGPAIAYLKELALSRIMAWFHNNQLGMDETMAAQAVALREQMSSHPS